MPFIHSPARRLLPTLLVLLPTSAGLGAQEPPTGPHQAELRTFLESYYDAFSDRDWARFQDHFWPGATLTTVWAPDPEVGERVVVTTIPDFVAQAPLGPGSRKVFEERMVSARFEIAGGLAQAWVRYDARFGDPGAIMEWSGVDAFNLIRHRGQWRIVSLAYAADGG
jgi:hypothetical protein